MGRVALSVLRTRRPDPPERQTRMERLSRACTWEPDLPERQNGLSCKHTGTPILSRNNIIDVVAQRLMTWRKSCLGTSSPTHRQSGRGVLRLGHPGLANFWGRVALSVLRTRHSAPPKRRRNPCLGTRFSIWGKVALSVLRTRRPDPPERQTRMERLSRACTPKGRVNNTSKDHPTSHDHSMIHPNTISLYTLTTLWDPWNTRDTHRPMVKRSAEDTDGNKSPAKHQMPTRERSTQSTVTTTTTTTTTTGSATTTPTITAAENSTKAKAAKAVLARAAASAEATKKLAEATAGKEANEATVMIAAADAATDALGSAATAEALAKASAESQASETNLGDGHIDDHPRDTTINKQTKINMLLPKVKKNDPLSTNLPQSQSHQTKREEGGSSKRVRCQQVPTCLPTEKDKETKSGHGEGPGPTDQTPSPYAPASRPPIQVTPDFTSFPITGGTTGGEIPPPRTPPAGEMGRVPREKQIFVRTTKTWVASIDLSLTMGSLNLLGRGRPTSLPLLVTHRGKPLRLDRSLSDQGIREYDTIWVMPQGLGGGRHRMTKPLFSITDPRKRGKDEVDMDQMIRDTKTCMKESIRSYETTLGTNHHLEESQEKVVWSIAKLGIEITLDTRGVHITQAEGDSHGDHIYTQAAILASHKNNDDPPLPGGETTRLINRSARLMAADTGRGDPQVTRPRTRARGDKTDAMDTQDRESKTVDKDHRNNGHCTVPEMEGLIQTFHNAEWHNSPEETERITSVLANRLDCWDLGTFRVDSSLSIAALRFLSQDEVGNASIRYLTPYSIWTVMKTGRGPWTWLERDPYPPEWTDLLPQLLAPGVGVATQLESALLVRAMLAGEDKHAEISIGEITQQGSRASYTGGARMSKVCGTCKKEHYSRFTIDNIFRKLNLRCGKKIIHSSFLTSHVSRHFFAHTEWHQKPKISYPTNVGDQDGPDHGIPRKIPTPRRARTVKRKPNKPGLAVLQYNIDRRPGSLIAMLENAQKDNIDIICVQEAQTITIRTETLAKYGFTAYRHGKTMIFTSINTTEGIRASEVWRSDIADAMGITLDTPQGTLLVACAYLPTGVDGMDLGAKEEISKIHMELCALANAHHFSILCMDGNETISKEGRITLHHNTAALSAGCPNDDLESSSMACYSNNMKDCHVVANPELHDPATPIGDRKIYTNVHSLAGGATSKSRIDYMWASNSIAHRLETSELLEASTRWGGREAQNYHLPIKSEFRWEGLWGNNEGDTQVKDLRGSWIPLGPDLRKLTPEIEQDISKDIQQSLYDQREIIRRTKYNRNTSAQKKRDALLNILERTCNRVTIQHVGRRTAPRTGTHQENSTSTLNHWDTLMTLISKVRKAHNFEPRANRITGPIHDTSEKLKKAGVEIPGDWEGLCRLWTHRFYHRSLLHPNSRETGWSDTEALANPKGFYKQMCKPPGSSRITSLRVKSKPKDKPPFTTIIHKDDEIEDALTGFLEHIANDEERWDPTTDAEIAAYKGSPNTSKFAGLMDKCSTEEVRRIVQDLGNTASVGNTSPRIIKIAVGRLFTQNHVKTAKQKKQEAIRVVFAQDTAERYEGTTATDELPGGHIYEPQHSRSDRNVETVEVTVQPNRAAWLLRDIINFCIETKDIPDTLKHTIVTGLPKDEGQVNDLDRIRPISVGPIVGRIVNKVLAARLGHTLSEHSILDWAQYAFLPGRNIHEPINTLISCFEQSLLAKAGSTSKQCLAIFYDISKAYDTVRWSSIKKALIRIGAPKTFIEYTMNSLKGTTLSMKTNIPGRVTPTVQVHKAIKQGCPLAPILFAIVMDELHAGYREIGGYKMNGGPLVSSRGYCDDTVILANDLPTLKRMNEWTHSFFQKHRLQINLTKSYLTGRDSQGNNITTDILWPDSNMKPLKRVATGYSIRYLGIWINADLCWKDHIKKMNAAVMSTVSDMRHRRVTTLQGCLLVKHVLGHVLDIGLRHVPIPSPQLEAWDKWIKGAIVQIADCTPTIHESAVWSILKTHSITDKNVLAKTTQLMDSLIQDSEMKKYYTSLWESPMKEVQTQVEKASTEAGIKMATRVNERDSRTTAIIKTLAQQGVHITRNGHHKNREAVQKKYQSDDHLTVGGAQIPYKDTLDLWGSTFKPPEGSLVVICTDGSTFPNSGKNSGAAYIYVDDDFRSNELWPKGFYCKIARPDNYMAEMQAINMALRSVPVTMPVEIFTDSLSSCQAIEKLLRQPDAKSTIRCASRPYLLAVRSAIREREKHGATTKLTHVYSHTGGRDRASIGNAGADRLAKYAGWEQNENDGGKTERILVERDLPFLVNTLTATTTKEGMTLEWKAIHGDIRKAVKVHQSSISLEEWSTRQTYGQLVRDNKNNVLRLIKGFWKDPTSTKIEFLLDTLNRADPKRIIDDKWTTTNCDRCGWHYPQTTFHRLTCPVNADLLNKADRDILECLVSNQPHDPEVDGKINDDENPGHALGTDSIAREANENLHKLIKDNTVRIHSPTGDERNIPYQSAAKISHMWTLTRRETDAQQQGPEQGTRLGGRISPTITNPGLTTGKVTNSERTRKRKRQIVPPGPKDKGSEKGPLIDLEIGRHIAILLLCTGDDTQEILCIGTVVQKPEGRKQLKIDYLDREDQQEPHGWWSKPDGWDPQCIRNRSTVIATVEWQMKEDETPSPRYLMGKSEWARIDKIRQAKLIDRPWERNNSLPGKNPKPHLQPGRRFGFEQQRGYRFKGPTDPLRPIEVAQINGKTCIVARVRITKDDAITPYAGFGKVRETDKYTQGEAALYRHYSIKGLTSPSPGLGLGSLCSTSARANSKYKMNNTPIKPGIWIIASRDIRPGEEITIPKPLELDLEHTTTKTQKRRSPQGGEQNAAAKRAKAAKPNKQITLEAHLDRTHSNSITNKAWVETPNLLKTVEGFLSITGILNTDAIHVPTHLRWWTPHEADTKLGASQGTVITFLTNNSTWINLAIDPQDDIQNIQRACLAATSGADWTRTVMLVRQDDELLRVLARESKTEANNRVRTHMLADMPMGAVDIHKATPPPAPGTPQSRTTNKNETPLQLILIESDTAPHIDGAGLRDAMKGITNQEKVYEPPWSKDIHSEAKLISHRRYSRHTRPTLSWYRRYPPREPDPEFVLDEMEQYDALAGMLGFIPPGLKCALIKSKHAPEYTTTNTIQQISDILVNTALEAFRRYQAWKRLKKYSLH